jgi:large subunit ribosomal protein L18
MSKALIHKALNKSLRKNRVRSRVSGTAERPRLTVTISNIHVSAQLIDDVAGKTLVSATTVGEEIAKKAKKAKINAVVFDRNGRQYAGRLSALADAARKEGLEF